ncbi:cytochrome P450 94B3-like [Pyrus x bretschneideri]|uniref:cytochrome P450 94B3-like n=1 Tax=Pyrus x bretschneideri TaxID=225117 RepID=UPI00202FAA83|nr:cytochrome P450 94B3-like [Pyrus x bretschneideri]
MILRGYTQTFLLFLRTYISTRRTSALTKLADSHGALLPAIFSPPPYLISFYIYHHFFASLKKYKHIGFKNYLILGTLPEFLKNRHRFLEWTTEILTSCPTSTAIFSRPVKICSVITTNPANVEHMLKTNFKNYPKGERFMSLIQDFLDSRIFNSDDELWKVQRKTTSYAFNTKSLWNFIMENVRVEIELMLISSLDTAA